MVFMTIYVTKYSYMKNQFIDDFKGKEKGKIVDELFAVKKKESIKTYSKGFMFTLTVSDKTGQVTLSFFGENNKDDVEKIYAAFDEQDVVHVVGKIDDYYNPFGIAVNVSSGKIEKVTEYEKSDFIPTTKKDITRMTAELKQIISDIENEHIKKLLNVMFDVEFMEKYVHAAAAMNNHHNVRGGLIEHVLSMIQTAIKVVELHPELDKDLLIAGCIFHDIGKVRELKVENTITYTTEGHLVGHISMGQRMVNEAIDKLEGFPEIMKYKIIHMILSHHGEKKWGSPIEPLFPEAKALHHIDNLDSTVQTSIQDKENANKDDEWIKDYKGWPKLYLK